MDWSGSVFNPSTNVDIGVAGIADDRAQVVAMFPRGTVLAASDTYVSASGHAPHAYRR